MDRVRGDQVACDEFACYIAYKVNKGECDATQGKRTVSNEIHHVAIVHCNHDRLASIR